MALQWEQVARPFSRLTEGPVWDGQRLLFTYIPASRIMAYDPETGECSIYRENTNHTNGLAFDADGRLYVCCSGGRSIVRLEPDGSTATIIDRLDGQRPNTPNDLAIDRRGRIWFSNPWNEGNIDSSEQQENMNRDILRADPQLDGSYTCQRMTFDTTGTNGLLVSPDERSLYIIQTNPSPDGVRGLRSYPINSDGSLGQYIVLHQFGRDHRGPQRGIDGMCLDSEGNIVGAARELSQRPRPHDIRLDTPGTGAGDLPHAGGRGRPHQLLLRRRRPEQPVRHHRPGSRAATAQHRAPRLDNVAFGPVARHCPGMPGACHQSTLALDGRGLVASLV